MTLPTTDYDVTKGYVPPTFRVYDSLLKTEYPTHTRHAVVYQPQWQAIRVGCSFTGIESVRFTLATLQAYIDVETDEEEHARRLWRVRNLLNAIPIDQVSRGFVSHQGAESRLAILRVRSEANALVSLHPKPKYWDWNEARQQIEPLWQAQPETLLKIYRNIRKNRNKPGKKTVLWHFLHMMEEETDNFGKGDSNA